MKGIIDKQSLRSNLLIGLSYYLFWLLAISISMSKRPEGMPRAMMLYSWQVSYVIFLNLLIHLVFVPFIRKKKQKWLWTGAAFGLFALFLLFGQVVWQKLGERFFSSETPAENESAMEGFMQYVIFTLFGTAYFAAIRFFIDSFRLRIKNQQLTIEKKDSELNYLRSQTNPHFLFNTLNNIYSLARDKSDLAPKSILQLSDILRYMLYETVSEHIAVEKEIKIIKDYIELEKLRYDDSLTVIFTIYPDQPMVKIPPLLMMPLVENAFKHGSSETVENPFIHIRLTIYNNWLLLEVENSTGDVSPDFTDKRSIGLSNLRRQLELLYNEFSLQTAKKENMFTATMHINLNSYAKD